MIDIVEMELSHIAEIHEIEVMCYPTPWNLSLFLVELSKSESDWFVAIEWAGVVGYVGTQAIADVAHVLNLAVRPGRRHEGIGRALLARALQAAAERRVDAVSLEVREGNVAAQQLYRSFGFETVGRRAGYYADTGEDGVLMTLSLRPAPPKTDQEATLGSGEVPPGREHATPGWRREPGVKRRPLLAIETSCDETAAAVVGEQPEVISSVVASQVEWHRRFGGVVPEIASRKHVELIGPVVDEALGAAGLDLGDISAVAVTHGPGLVGALLVGMAFAKGVALAGGLPLVGVNHLEGHLFAVMLDNPEAEPPFVALVVSGGHTSLLYCCELGEYETLGETLDDAVGEAFDKVAKYMGLGYPGGPEISKLAEHGDPTAVEFPRAMLHSGDYDLSLSGLKTAVITHVRKEREAGREPDPADLAASFQAAAIDVPVAKTVRAAKEKRVDTVLLGGGVAANAELRERLAGALLAEDIAVLWPSPAMCTDNAAMIGAAGQFRLWRGETIGLDANALPNLRL